MSKIALHTFRILTVMAILILLACAGAKKKPIPFPEGRQAPSNLIVETANGTMDLSWTTNRSPEVAISGYNIYISQSPFASSLSNVEPFNLTVYPGDDNPDIAAETYTATGLENGVKYYVAVTTVYPDRTESMPSNIVEAVCYPRGTVMINDRAMGEPHGFSFAKEENVDYNSVDNDLYFIARDVGNMIGSPDRNEGVLKHTEFAELPSERVLNDKHNYSNLSFKDRTYVAEGNIYLLKLSNGGFAKIKVKQVDSSQYKRQIVFDYIYLAP